MLLTASRFFLTKMKSFKTQHTKLLADELTPVSIYLRVREYFASSILLESLDFSNHQLSKSFICFNPIHTFKAENNTLIHNGLVDEKINLPQDDESFLTNHIDDFLKRFKSENNYTNQYNGFYGYTGYSSVKYFENLKSKNTKHDVPDLEYSLYKYVIVFDHYHQEIIVIENLLEEEKSELQRVLDLLQTNYSVYPFEKVGNESISVTDNEFKQLVTTAKKHCQQGDVFQLVLSRQIRQSFIGDDFNVYRALRSINPSPFLFYLDTGNFKIFGSSPESQLIVKNNEATIHPIAGTYKRTGNDDEDQKLATKLLNDKKENAEHIMLVDLARNDLSKFCNVVKVNYLKKPHFYSHVIHLVSEVNGILKNNEPFKALADTFPAGTLSGTPKPKALELIDNYENNTRSFYGGAIGIFNFNGDVNHAIIIRSFLSKNKTLLYQSGAGITINSEEKTELEEINNKIEALRKAIDIAVTISSKNKSYEKSISH